MTQKQMLEVRSVPSGALVTIDEVECGTTPIDVPIMYHALKYVAETDDLMRRAAIMSAELLPLATFTSVGTKSDFDAEIQKNFDFFMYFGHGLDDCIFDENGYCAIYPDSNLKDKILVLTACDCGNGYAKTAVRTHEAIAAIGYSAPLSCQLSGDDGFREGFKECFLNSQKLLLACNEVTESEFVSAYETTKALYNSWGDHYKAAGDDLCAAIFYFNANHVISYSEWDAMTTINISVDPVPAEIYMDGVFIGLAPLANHPVMSGGNHFRYKAMGCSKTGFTVNVPKTGDSYSMYPTANNRKYTRHYQAEKIYLEHDKWINVAPEQFTEPLEMYFFNYDNDSCTATVSNDRGWRVDWPHENTLYTHQIGGNPCRLCIEEAFEFPPADELRTEYVNVTVVIGTATDTFSVPIYIVGPWEHEQGYSGSTFSPFSNQYNQMSAPEKDTRNIAIGTKTYTPTEIMEEIDKGTEIGVMLMEAMR